MLESFKQTGLVSEKKQSDIKKEGKETTISGSSGSGIVYELYYAPEHARLNQLASVAELEKKIDRLETLVGNNPDKLVRTLTSVMLLFFYSMASDLFQKLVRNQSHEK